MTTITIERALLEKIIEKFAACGCEVCTRQSIEALKAALAAPATAPEPVAWLAHYVGRSGMEQEYVSTDKNLADENDASGKALPLYLHPPATAPDELEQLRKDSERMREALMFYAEGDHFTFDRDAWDTVSDEPQNYWCDEAGTATVEDGTIAKLALDAAMKGTP
jgi:hypothetical protein